MGMEIPDLGMELELKYGRQAWRVYTLDCGMETREWEYQNEVWNHGTRAENGSRMNSRSESGEPGLTCSTVPVSIIPFDILTASTVGNRPN